VLYINYRNKKRMKNSNHPSDQWFERYPGHVKYLIFTKVFFNLTPQN